MWMCLQGYSTLESIFSQNMRAHVAELKVPLLSADTAVASSQFNTALAIYNLLFFSSLLGIYPAIF